MINRTIPGLAWTGIFQALILGFFWPYISLAQEHTVLPPVTRTYAITNVNIIQAPGRKIDQGTVIIKDGLIAAAGKGITIPAEAVVIKADSMYMYAGFIDGLSRTGVNKPKDEVRERVPHPGNPPPERAGVTPQVDVRNFLSATEKSIEELRSVGFASAQVVPYGVLLPGSAAVIQLSGKPADEVVIVSKSALYSELSSNLGIYPGSILGIMAKWRDLYRQAALARSYEALYATNRAGVERPATDRILEAFYPVVDKRTPVLFKAEKLLDAHRVMTLQTDLGFPLVIGGLKEGWDVINKLKATNTKVLLSLDLPDELKESKKDTIPVTSEKAGLEKRKADFAFKYEAQASTLHQAGMKFGFSTMDAKPGNIRANLRRMIKAGLSEDAALAALTTNAAEILGVSDRLGTIDNGKIANLVITDKPYFNEKANVRYVFVDGQPFKQEAREIEKADITGIWTVTTETPDGKTQGTVSFTKEGNNYSGNISGGRLPQSINLTKVELNGNALKYSYSFAIEGGQTISVDVEATLDGDAFKGTAIVPQLGSFPVEGKKDPKKN